MPDTPDPTEARRVALVRSLDLLGMPADPALQALADCAARMAQLPIAMVTVVDAEHQWHLAAAGLDRHAWPRIAREAGCCTHAVGGHALLEIPDVAADPRVAALPVPPGVPTVRFYAGQPLVIDGLAVGCLCVLGPVPHALSAAERTSLQDLARVGSQVLQARRHLHDATVQRERLLDFARAAGDWMWETDADHRYCWLSDAVEPLTGLAREALLGQTVADAPLLDAHGQEQPGGLMFHHVLARQAAFTRVISAMDTPRGRLHISRSAVPVFDAARRFRGYRGTSRDVTATVAVTVAARRSEHMLLQLTAQVPGVLFIVAQTADGDCECRFVSDGATRQLGVPVHELLAETAAFLDRLSASERRRLVVASERSVTQQRMLEHSFQARGPDDRLTWYEVRATASSQAGGQRLWHGVLSDISERMALADELRQHEERWQLGAAAAAIGILQLTLSDGLIRLDERASAHHGLPHPNAGIAVDDWLALVDPVHRGKAADELQRVLTQGARFDGRLRLRRPDGSARWLEFIARATHDAQGVVTGAIGTSRDVHEQQIADKLQRDKEEAERASRAKSAFLSRVSHELRTPLNGILGFAQLMALDREHPLGSVQSQRLASVQRAGRQLLGLVNDVLELSRVENADASLAAAVVDLGAALRASIALAQPLAQARGVTLVAPPAVDAWVRGDARAIEQVLGNLLGAVIQHAPEQATLTIGIARAGAHGTPREIGVRIGVDAADDAAIGSDAAAGVVGDQGAAHTAPPEAAGTRCDDNSLALVIARQLALAMGGRVDSAVEGDTCRFTLWLAATGALVRPGAAPPHPAPDDGVRHVLYIEDEPLNQILVQEVFRARPHWQLHLATDGAAGLRMARQLAPQLQLVLIDMNLPDTNGVALLGQLRSDARTAGLRCIALSADALREQIDVARAAGFENYWTKPIDVPQVLAALDALLDPPAS